MRIVKAGFERITEKDPIKKIEQIARVCYKSEDKICEGSAVKMVGALVRSNHYAMLEHGSIIMEVGVEAYSFIINTIRKLQEEYGVESMLRYTDVLYSGRYIVSGNLRMWLEFVEYISMLHLPMYGGIWKALEADKYKPVFDAYRWENLTGGDMVKVVDPEYLTDKERLVHEDLSIKFIVDRGVSHEIVRHRKASFAQESTRYCNYGKSGEVVFVEPPFIRTSGGVLLAKGVSWKYAMQNSEISYLDMISKGCKPQEARDVLPTSVKTELVMTANLKEWIHFFDLRALGTTGAPHPQMLEVAVPAMQDVISDHKFLEDYLEV